MVSALSARWFAWSFALALVGAGAALLAAPRAHADGMRCGSRLISDGDPMYEVRNVCGVPDQASQRFEQRFVSRVVQNVCYDNRGRAYACTTVIQEAIVVVLDEWYYDFGRSVLVRTLVFEGGRLVKVVTGGYGTKDT